MPKVRQMIVGRRGQIFAEQHQDQDKKQPTAADGARHMTICVHCASLGEFEQGRPLIESLRKSYPAARLVLTFFSSSGYEIRKHYSGVDAVYYLPIDTRGAVRKFIEQLQPDMLFLVKYEFWYNLLQAAHDSGCRIFLVSAIFRHKSQFFRSSLLGGNFFRNILHLFDHIFVQDQQSVDLLSSIGLTRTVSLCGDTRFDRVASLATSAPEIESIARLVGQSPTVVCGSTWGPDEALIVETMKAHPEWKFIIAPHEISEERIDRLVAASARRAVKYSQIENATGDETLIIINTIGILSSVYRYAWVSYIGGGFGVGIHNTLEAAAWGKPVIFGPKYQKFQEAVGLVDCGAAACITSVDELTARVEQMMANHHSIGMLAAQFVESNIGATNKIMNFELIRPRQ